MGIFESEAGPVPITVIGGFLGAGKTTLLNYLLHESAGRRIAVLVNDFGSVNIDAELIVGVQGDVITMSNGCLCCTIKNDVVGALLRLIERKDRPEHVVIETSGISNPGAVVDTFLDLQRAGAVRLDGVVVVIDAENYGSLESSMAGLAKWQVQAADLVVVNKTDLVASGALEAIEAGARSHAPGARIVRAKFGRVPLDILLASSPREAHEHSHAHEHGHDHDHAHDHEHDTALEAHGFASWRFTTPKPMRFRALADVLKSLPPAIFRAKGFVNLVERPDDRVVVHAVGKRLFVRTLAPWGDRPKATDLVFIGLDEGATWSEVEQRLLACC